MYPFYLELELTKPVIDYFKDKGYIVRREIKIGFNIADMVCFKEKEVIAVELKLRNWKKAIIQAKNYQLGSDYVYIAFPLMKSHNILKKAQHILKKEGIGLLVINEKNTGVKEIIKPSKSKRKIASITLNEINKRTKKRYHKF